MSYEPVLRPAVPGYFDLDVNDLHPPEEMAGKPDARVEQPRSSRSLIYRILTEDERSALTAKRRYSLSLFDYTKSMWENARSGIE